MGVLNSFGNGVMLAGGIAFVVGISNGVSTYLLKGNTLQAEIEARIGGSA